MNKLKTLALLSICLFCVAAIVGTLVPFYVQALDTEEMGRSVGNSIVYEKEKITLDSSATSGENVEFLTETRIEEIPYEVREVEVDTIPKGTREIVSKGECGKVRNTYLVKYVDGIKVDEALYTQFLMSSPTEQVENVGVGGVVTANDGTAYNYSYKKQMEATAYTYLPPYVTMTTATGATLRRGIVAVDPTVIPMHTKMFITGSYEYGVGVAEDTGGAIKGNIVDLAFETYDECIYFGRRQMQVYILE